MKDSEFARPDIAVTYVIDDDLHSEVISNHATFADARKEIDRLIVMPWNEEPNQAPCANWRNCGRRYEIVEYDTSTAKQWREVQRTPIVEISAKGVNWLDETHDSA